MLLLLHLGLMISELILWVAQIVEPFPANRSSLDKGKPGAILGRKVTDPTWMAGLSKERFFISSADDSQVIASLPIMPIYVSYWAQSLDPLLRLELDRH